MKNLFESRRFLLIEIKRTGKKQTPSNLILKGLLSNDGCPEKIVAAESGTVVCAGHPCIAEFPYGERDKHYGILARVRSNEDPRREIIYYGLGECFVRAGEHVRTGEGIGHNALALLGVEVRYNGRRVDALAELGIPATIGKVLSMDKPAMLPTCR